MPTLEVNDLRTRYSRSGPEILKGLSFSVEPDDFFAIIGPSGAGKSTLIRCINRLVEPNSGDVILNGNNITKMGRRELRKARRNMGMIFQEFNLVERMSSWTMSFRADWVTWAILEVFCGFIPAQTFKGRWNY
jgi:phosphonate transport system ATP-binding protein